MYRKKQFPEGSVIFMWTDKLCHCQNSTLQECSILRFLSLVVIKWLLRFFFLKSIPQIKTILLPPDRVNMG